MCVLLHLRLRLVFLRNTGLFTTPTHPCICYTIHSEQYHIAFGAIFHPILTVKIIMSGKINNTMSCRTNETSSPRWNEQTRALPPNTGMSFTSSGVDIYSLSVKGKRIPAQGSFCDKNDEWGAAEKANRAGRKISPSWWKEGSGGNVGRRDRFH